MNRSPSTRLMLLVSFALVAIACDAESSSTPGADAAAPGDAARAQDGALADAGAIADGSAPAIDAAARSDGGQTPSAIDLSAWKLTLPTGEPRSPEEILQPELSTFELEPYFVRLPDGQLQFRAHAGGVTTSGSGYPRSELREMSASDPRALASWSTTEGVHEMRLVQTITHLPEVKPHVVAGQIHDAGDDVIMIRLERRRLFVEGDGDELALLDADYELGTEFAVRISASEGHIRVDYLDDGSWELDLEREAIGCYFKAGVYTQSNASRGDREDAYGEVLIRALEVSHR